MPGFEALNLRTVLLHVGVGMGSASFWRGAWYMLDDHLFPDEKAYSAMASLGLGTLGMAASQGLMQRCEQMASLRSTSALSLRVARFAALYTVAMSVVLVWRGTWVGWDVLYEHLHNAESRPWQQQQQQRPDQSQPQSSHNTSSSSSPPSSDDTVTEITWQELAEVESMDGYTPVYTDPQALAPVRSTDPGHLTKSGFASHVAAVTILLGSGLFASVLAPPAAVSVIRDFTIQASGGSSSRAATMIQGPAQRLVQAIWKNSATTATPAPSASRAPSLGTSPVTSRYTPRLTDTMQYRTRLSTYSSLARPFVVPVNRNLKP